MSYPVFPSNVAWRFGYKKSPVYNTVVQTPAAGRGITTASLKPYPTWAFEADLSVLQGNETAASSVMAAFLGTYMACSGGAGFFLYTDVFDNTVGANGGLLDVTTTSTTPMASTGNGVSRIFQLARTIGGLGWDIIQNATVSTVTVNGSTATCAVSPTGVVTFTTAPAAASVLKWTGTFQFLCRWEEDTLESLTSIGVNSNGGIWTSNSVKFQSVLL